MNLSDFLAWPEGAPLLALAPLAGLLLWRLERGKRKRIQDLLGPRFPEAAADLGRASARRRLWLHVFGLLAALLALLQPVFGVDANAVTPRGADVMVCLDVSRSMLARDIQPNRLAAARRDIQVLARRAQGDRLGLVVFAGDARLLVPLTSDSDSFANLVEEADELSIPRGGTDLGAALDQALAGLVGATGDHGTILLVTDGEDHEERGLRAAASCKERGVTVHCVGFGTILGSKIAVPGANGESFLRDATGQEVVTALRPDSLAKLAATTGGTYATADSEHASLVEVYEKEILPGARRGFAIQERSARGAWFQVPLLLAFLAWVWELGLWRGGGSRGGRKAGRGGVGEVSEGRQQTQKNPSSELGFGFGFLFWPR